MNRIAKMDDKKRKEMAEYYQEMLGQLGLESYTKTSYIRSVLNMNGRTWRKHVENIMHLYMYDYLDKMVIGTNKGYLLTGDTELINRFLKAKEHQFKALAYNCYNLKKALSHKDNYSIDDYINDALCD